MFAMTAAHRNLPLPSYAKVTNLENGRTVVVRINDRGPFAHDRIVDLSYAAATRLGIVAAGTGLVELRVLDPADPEAPVVAADPAGPPPLLYVQVGAFGSRDNAERVLERLNAAGLYNVALSPHPDASPPLWRVRAGPVADVEAVDDGIKVGGDTLKVLAVRDPKELPWGDLGVDVVVESTGIFTARDKAALHLDGGAPFVVVSAPSSGADGTFVVGVNDDTFDGATQKVVSNASCTTNCFVPMVKVLDDAFGVEKGLMTTVHAYTGDQMLVDGPHKDLRRARAAAINIVPTGTGAARATGLVLESMQGRLDGTSLRVPVPTGSITDFVGTLNRDVTADEVNEAFRAAAESGPLAGVIALTDGGQNAGVDPLAAVDLAVAGGVP